MNTRYEWATAIVIGVLAIAAYRAVTVDKCLENGENEAQGVTSCLAAASGRALNALPIIREAVTDARGNYRLLLDEAERIGE